MSTVSFADVVHQSINFEGENPAHRLILDLIDTPWVQRLRDISQTANTRLVYMFSEHSRFGHSLGVAYLATVLMDKLSRNFPDKVEPYRMAVGAAALLHDIGHLAPGSHSAHKAWFSEIPDQHELVAVRIIRDEKGLPKLLKDYEPTLVDTISAILSEDESVPPWTWEILSGGGWNVDRGNWCIVDSILGGVSYGTYNIPAITDSMVITSDGHLALSENRLDAMMHFAVSRHALYRQMYQHRVLLAADMLTRAIVQRARDLEGKSLFADDVMAQALGAHSPDELSLDTIFWMRESWWRYHLMHWARGSDTVLADLANRSLNRDLLKTVRLSGADDQAELRMRAADLCKSCGFDPRYYLHTVSTFDVHAGDFQRSILVALDDGRVKPFSEAEPVFHTMAAEGATSHKQWLVMPKEVKEKLGKRR